MQSDLGKHLFTFAVISDSHVNEAEDASVSPYACNKLANGRLRYVVAALNRQQPAFTVHLGDMGNPLPELATYEPAARSFKAIAGELASPLYLVAGNHCVGDKPTGWVPVPRVSEKSLAQYARHYGPLYYAFDHGPCRFMALSSLLVNSGLEQEREQRRWLEQELDRASRDGRRIWVMMHYPPYVASPDELGSYDNVDEPGRSWLLGLFERHGVEAAYSGHVHNYFYNRYAATDLYTLPATSFVRQDYSEMFSVEPEDAEGGRNDLAKLGYCLVRVCEQGHFHHLVRTYGEVLEVHARPTFPEWMDERRPRQAAPASVGVEMRDDWLSRLALRANNSVSPFTRRCARNDWGVLALEEMGVSKVRIFLQELANEAVLERMATLKTKGYEFIVYSYGVPDGNEYDVVRKHRRLLAGWELIVSLAELEPVMKFVAKVEAGLPGGDMLPFYLNEVRDASQAQVDDANVKHEANYGFQLTDEERIAKLLQSEPGIRSFQGLVFRVRRRGEPQARPYPAIQEVGRIGKELGMRHQVHVLFSGNFTADRLDDDVDSANRVAESAVAAMVAGNVDVYFDTFEDVDRGYFVRHGLVDRRYNPRLPAKVLRHLNATLTRYRTEEIEGCFDKDLPGGRSLTVHFARRFLTLVMPSPRCIMSDLDAPESRAPETLVLLDLESGVLSDVAFKIRGSRLFFAKPVSVESPLLALGSLG